MTADDICAAYEANIRTLVMTVAQLQARIRELENPPADADTTGETGE